MQTYLRVTFFGGGEEGLRRTEFSGYITTLDVSKFKIKLKSAAICDLHVIMVHLLANTFILSPVYWSLKQGKSI